MNNNNLSQLSNFKPFMDQNEITAITTLLKSFEKPIQVLEWGSGNSTIYYSLLFENRNKWLSIEHDQKWAERNKEEIGKLSLYNTEIAFIKTNLSHIEGQNDGDINAFFDYVKYPAKLDHNYDVIFVDGRARVWCLEEGWKMLKPDGTMVLHDAQRKEYDIGIPKDAYLIKITNTKVNSEGNIATLFMFKSPQLLRKIISELIPILPEHIIISARMDESEWEHYKGKRHHDNVVLKLSSGKQIENNNLLQHEVLFEEIASLKSDEDAPEDFLNPILEVDNMDIYLSRQRLLSALKENLSQFRGTFLELGWGQMFCKSLLTSLPCSIEKYLGLDIGNHENQEYRKPEPFSKQIKIPIEDGIVDTIVVTEVFEHLPDLQDLLKEVYRVLKPGGILFFSASFLWPFNKVPYDEFRYTPFSLERILKENNFSEIKLKAMGGWNASLAQMIGLWLRRSPLNSNQRLEYGAQLFSFYKALCESDVIPATFTENTMITGITGLVRKGN
ncbi:MAG TPA: class I SAM-dependent methyltransferase [Ignavibacteriales bacterium]|nr:class I SAM-dependent methyltransferase [Ignavibacteriales bacterium]